MSGRGKCPDTTAVRTASSDVLGESMIQACRRQCYSDDDGRRTDGVSPARPGPAGRPARRPSRPSGGAVRNNSEARATPPPLVRRPSPALIWQLSARRYWTLADGLISRSAASPTDGRTLRSSVAVHCRPRRRRSSRAACLYCTIKPFALL